MRISVTCKLAHLILVTFDWEEEPTANLSHMLDRVEEVVDAIAKKWGDVQTEPEVKALLGEDKDE